MALYPFTWDTQSEAIPADDPRVVVINPTVSFGRPVIVGTGIPVASIYERYKAGDSVADLATDFRLGIGLSDLRAPSRVPAPSPVHPILRMIVRQRETYIHCDTIGAVARGIEFDWDDENKKHLDAHKVAPAEFEQVLCNDPLDLTFELFDDEDRYRSVGLTNS